MPVLLAVLVVLAALVAVCLARAAALRPANPKGSPLDAGGFEPDDACVERFRTLLRIPTVSRQDEEDRDDAAFEDFRATVHRLYPHTFQAFEEPTYFHGYGFLMRWPGADPTLAPVVMMAHHDVVPTEGQDWAHPPFAAEVHDGEIWARGALDNKCCFTGCLEAFEHLASQGYVPPRDLWFFSSCGEETASPVVDEAVAWLAAHDVRPCLVLDEGGAIATGVPLGVTAPMAMVGISEKGQVNLTVRATSAGGHASSPSDTDATRLLVRACERICANPGRPRLVPAVEEMLRELAARGSFAYRFVFANLWLFRPLVTRIIASGAETGPMARTTYALTQLAGSTAQNVLPSEATANLNVRVAPFERIQDALGRAQAQAKAETDAAGGRGAVRVELAQGTELNEPAPLSPFDDAQFDYLRRVLAGTYPEAGVCPYVQMSASDSRAFGAICQHVYRLAPFVYTPTYRGLIHGANERIGVDVFRRGVAFYVAFVRGLGQLGA